MKGIKELRLAEGILIYQMGKVGSSSIQNSLNGSLNVHSLYCNPPNPPHLHLSYPYPYGRIKYYLSSLIKRLLIKNREKTKIITVVRCPYERNVSMFFQALPFWMSLYYSGFGDKSKAHTNKGEGVDVLWDCFVKNFNHDYPVTWFDKEVCRLTGFSVPEINYDKDKGSGLRLARSLS